MNTSVLTIEGLKRAKARGEKLGGPDIAKATAAAGVVNRQSATDFAEKMRPIVSGLMTSGVASYSAIAREFNKLGIRTRQDRTWYPTTVKNLMIRIKEL